MLLNEFITSAVTAICNGSIAANCHPPDTVEFTVLLDINANVPAHQISAVCSARVTTHLRAELKDVADPA
jgi:hypothetical protein